jgi:hypothetical protein
MSRWSLVRWDGAEFEVEAVPAPGKPAAHVVHGGDRGAARYPFEIRPLRFLSDTLPPVVDFRGGCGPENPMGKGAGMGAIGSTES